MSTKTTHPVATSLYYGKIKTIVIPSSKFAYTTVAIMFKTGSVNDSKEKSGLNYMVYRLLVDHIYRNGLMTSIYTSGGLLKTSVDKELICYSIQTFSSNIVDILDKLLSIFDSLHFTEEELNKVKNFLIAESYQVYDNITDYMYKVTYEKSFVRQSISRSIYGKESTINKITAEDVYDFFYKSYNSNNAVVVIATKEESICTKEIEKSIASSVIGKRDIDFMNNIRKHKFIPRDVFHSRNVKNFYWMCTYPMNGFNYIDDALKSLIIEDIFNETTKSSLLVQSVSDIVGMKISVTHYFNIGLMHICSISNIQPDSHKRYMQQIMEKYKPSYIEIYRILQSVIIKIKDFYKDSLRSAIEYARHYMYLKKIKNPAYELGILQEMKSEHINDYMHQILNKQPTTVAINPKKSS